MGITSIAVSARWRDYAYTPESGPALARVVSALHQHYPRRTVGECRELVALMFGYESWLLLETAAMCGDASLPDDDETVQRVAARRSRQYRILLTHFGGGATPADAEQDGIGAEPSHGFSIARRHDMHWRRQRIEHARCAYHLVYARHVIDEIKPSGRDGGTVAGDDDSLHLSLRVELLPRALMTWVEQQRPRLAGLAERMAGVQVRQHSQCDALNFAFLWGEACITHPTQIPEMIQAYPLALCAKWYAWNAAAQLVAGHLSLAPSLMRDGRLPLPPLLADPTLEYQRTLLRAQPREDLASLPAAIRERQVDAGYALLRPYLEQAAAASTPGPVHAPRLWGTAARALRG